MTRYYHIFESVIGPITCIATDRGLCQILHRTSDLLPEDAVPNPAKIKPYQDEILRFLSGAITSFSLPMDILSGTILQRDVWKQLQRIPYGQTISYSELARRVGSPNAVRAVGSACGKNPIPLLIPCHRVLAKDGTLGGFGWGLPVKQALLALEQQNQAQAA